jgi:hypothetical protein
MSCFSISRSQVPLLVVAFGDGKPLVDHIHLSFWGAMPDFDFF